MVPVSEHLDELVRASALITQELDFRRIISILVEQSLDVSRSDLAVLYLYRDPEEDRGGGDLIPAYRRGRGSAPRRLERNGELIPFIEESGEAVLLLERCRSPFETLLLDPEMQSGIAIPLITRSRTIGILFLNSREPLFYGRERFRFLDSFTRLAGGVLANAKLYGELQEHLAKIRRLELYQENIFASMTNALVTLDHEGNVEYFNDRARESFSLTPEDLGRKLSETIGSGLSRKVVKLVERAGKDGKEILGFEGIYRGTAQEIDFSLNLSPLKGQRGRNLGMTLLFTDQSRERELKEKMESVVEERRMIKDMFSRYLSEELVHRLVETPELFRPGGDKKNATIFFADIRGYTSFSEGKDPEYIIQILNEYFGEAVEIVVRNRGYIDKFIGDCIMAAWGVPLQTEAEDAIQAVTCALEIQQSVASKKRSFFRGEAEHLRIGIGLHSGPLVAGNLGSIRRMNYTVIGDTVNVAARLEGVAGPGEVIITHDTREYLGDRFLLEERKPVKVKGKAQPLRIYNVRERVS